jgi:hypothetical protein
VDPRQAQDSLDEVRTREKQVADVVARDGAPWWYMGGIALAFLVAAVSNDLDDRWGASWMAPVFDYVVPVVVTLGICGLALALHRSMGVRPRRYSRPFRRGTLWLAAAFLVVYIGLGMVLRLADVGWSSTISGVAAALVFLGGGLVLRRTAGSRSN